MFILDTNLVSELRKVGAGKADARVSAWIRPIDAADLYLSAITVMELELGALLLERKDARQGAIIRRWLDKQVLPTFDGRVLPVDAVVAQRCAKLHVPNPTPGRDALIAATGLVHGMVVATRNTADFERTGVRLFNPWQAPLSGI